jgi:predicted Zn-dependent peptidase
MKKSNLKTYHVTFYASETTNILSCYNIEATNMLEAIKSHFHKFPNIDPLYVLQMTQKNPDEK